MAKDKDYLAEITGDTPNADDAGGDEGVLDNDAGGAEGAEGEGDGTQGADNDGTGGQQDGSQGNQPNKPNQQPQRADKGKTPDKQGKGPRAPGKGDLVDPQTGKVIARAGEQRRIYERAWNDARGRVTPLMQRADAEITRLKGVVAGFEQAGNIGKELGLSATEQVSGAKLMAAYKKDPGRTINYLLTEAKAAGHNIEIGGNINTDALGKMIDTKMKPFTDREAAATAMSEARQRATQEITNFYSTNPNAKVHEASIAKLMGQYPNLSLETAYLRLQNWMLQNGLDPNVPLEKQVKQPARGNNNGNGRARPMINGRAPSGNQLANVDDAEGQASTNDSYGSIVKRAMRTAGMSIN